MHAGSMASFVVNLGYLVTHSFRGLTGQVKVKAAILLGGFLEDCRRAAISLP